jgi:predicted RecB family nuclease
LAVSASDLNNFLACDHLTALDLARARGELTIEPQRGADAELRARKGEEYESQYLEALKGAGRQVAEIADGDGSHTALLDAVARTEEAMRDGADVIYQATFFRDELRGHADFLFRVDRPSGLGEHSYEVADTKLARRAKPYFILQLCFNSELMAAVQGVEPESIHVILGDGEQRSFRLAEFSAYFRRVRSAFLAALADGQRNTYPEPVAHCEICRWRALCDERREADDHLSLVANITGRQRELLRGAGVDTLAALGSARDLSVGGIDAGVLERLHEQAGLQLAARESGSNDYRLRPPAQGRGFARLPRRSEGDVFFDMEGDPLFDGGGLEYLFGLVTADGGGAPEFSAIWGRDRAKEKLALERFIDFVTERRRRFPDLHVYHYNHYEVTALKRIAGAHGTREEELDQLLRDEVFVDLYKVVREAMLISQPSYSIKKVEAFYMDGRDTAVTDGGDSVIMFERWLEEGDEAILGEIADYNRDDCISTLKLRDWLLDLRAEAEHEFDGRQEADWIRWFEPELSERSEAALAIQEENEALMRSLLVGIPDDPAQRDADQRARLLMAQAIEYHHREARPVWWAFFDRMEAAEEALKDDADCIAMLARDGETPARQEKKSLVERLVFPPQETKMGPGSDAVDPADGGKPGTIVALDAEQGWLELKRGPKLQQRPLPEALIPGGPYRTDQQQGALRRLAATLIEDGADSLGERYAAARRILRRDPPHLRDREPGAEIDHQGMAVDELKKIVASLDGSHLFIQGPPGSGKTWAGARLVVDLIGRGKRVGVTSTSHKIIHNLLDEVEEVAHEQGVDFKGLKKSGANPDSEFESPHGLIDSIDDNAALNDPEVALTAGTAWHYCREDTEPLDYLFIDEAGQVSLADALALATAAHNVVLLGDPQQLPQVAHAAHPEGSSLSVLEHLLGEAQTVDAAYGVFLEQTYRLHPDIRGFVSELMYDGRLRSAPGRERQRVEASGELTATGLRWLPVEHEGHSQSSPEEAERIATAIEPLLSGATYTDADGAEHPLKPEDILVLTPYNAQVRCLQDRLPASVRIGTVDKFQGQQAQVAFFSMATSSDEEVPRNVEFLFSRNRLNVAVSRARCLAVLVCNPHLLDIHATSIEQMRLVNALCAFTEIATGEAP